MLTEEVMRVPLRRRGVPFSAFCVFVTLAVVGCGKSSGTVSGKVTLDGKPVPGGSINFACLNEDGQVQTARSASIDKDGSYLVAKIPEGPVKITIQGPPHGVPPEALKRMRSRGGPGPGRTMRIAEGEPVDIPTRYTDEKTTDLTYTVVGGNQEHDIALTK
jgi:hypothetical protein